MLKSLQRLRVPALAQEDQAELEQRLRVARILIDEPAVDLFSMRQVGRGRGIARLRWKP